MLLGLTQLAGVPVKVSPHRSLNTNRGVIRSRDIAGCSVEEIVEELQPQGVTAAVTFTALFSTGLSPTSHLAPSV